MNFFNSDVTFKQFISELFMEQEQKFDSNYYYVSFKLNGAYKNWLLEYQNLITDDVIYNNETESFGREFNPHITIMYPLTEDCLEQLKGFCSTFPESNLVYFSELSIFKNEEKDYDVLVAKVDDVSGVLTKIHNFCMKFSNNWEYPYYEPHCTIAYVKKGICDCFDGKPIEDLPPLLINEISYLDPDGNETVISIGG